MSEMSNLNPLNFGPGYRVLRMIVESRGAGVSVAGHSLRSFKRAARLQVKRDARASKAVIAQSVREPSRSGAAFDH